MKKYQSFIRLLTAATFIVGVMFIALGLNVPSAAATTPTTITVDGTLGEWFPDENMGAGGGSQGNTLFITWDATNMYIGLASIPTAGGVQIFFDMISGGGTVPVVGSFTIGQGTQGYEYAVLLANGSTNTSYFGWDSSGPGSWSNVPPFVVTPTGSGHGASNTGVELKIPWANIGSPAGPITVLVTTNDSSSVYDFWPVAGNTSPNFTIGYQFASPGADGESPNGTPTAIQLDNILGQSGNNTFLVMLGVAFLLLGTGLLVLRKRLALRNI